MKNCMSAVSLVAICVCSAPSLLLAHTDDFKMLYAQPRYERTNPFALMRQHLSANGLGRGINTSSSSGDWPSFDAHNITWLNWVSLDELDPFFGSEVGRANDIWGYVSKTGREYALLGVNPGLAVIEVSDPQNPQIVAGIIGKKQLWHDVKVYGDYAYTVNDGGVGQGLQVIDLSDVDNGVVRLANTVFFNGGAGGAAHNVAINEDSGMLYLLGGDSYGMRIYDLTQDPENPTSVGAWSARYIHDAQIVTWEEGPYAGRDVALCCTGNNFGFSSPGLTILDVTDPANIKQLSVIANYANASYSHQGWLSRDRRYFYLGDELDEDEFGLPTTTRIFDLSDLDDPKLVGSFTNGLTATDHNLYVKGNNIFEANYRSGLRVFNAADPLNPQEVAYFDTYPEDDDSALNGLWSNYPYFPSGTIVGSDMEKGLFVWRLGAPPSISFPRGLPGVIPAAGQDVPVVIDPQGQHNVLADSAKLMLKIGNGFEVIDMDDLGQGRFVAPFPAGLANTPKTVSYYFTIETQEGLRYTLPPLAPVELFDAVASSTLTLVDDDDFETDRGWTQGAPGDTAYVGKWERAIPNRTQSQPAEAYSGQVCWITDARAGHNVASYDVDGGTTSLTSPAFDMSALNAPVIAYVVWYSNSVLYENPLFSTEKRPHRDVFEVQLSDDGGLTWTTVETIGPAGTRTFGGWWQRAVVVEEHVSASTQVKLRFIATDSGRESVVEAAVDDVRVYDAP